jgi:hypothetical protein
MFLHAGPSAQAPDLLLVLTALAAVVLVVATMVADLQRDEPAGRTRRRSRRR